MDNQINKEDLLGLTTEIVTAYCENNTLPANDIPALITTVFETLSDLGDTGASAFARLTPAVPIDQSIAKEHIICLEDGKKLKLLKRHLKTAYNMSPEEYRTKWNLPADYPMVAPGYAEKRSSLAKKIGLGTKRKRA